MDSILDSIKKLLGIHETHDHFDEDIIFHINTVFVILGQIGVGPEEGFSINDRHSKWEDYLSSEGPSLELVKTYMYLKVRLMFDPPINSPIIESINRTVDELEWRISTIVDLGSKE